MQRTTGGTIIVPVVVHVLWNTNTQNISDVQILSQIDVLNEDFGGGQFGSESDTCCFQSSFGNAQIYFCMASQTPGGASSNGIERRQVSQASFNSGDAVIKDYAQGGLSGMGQEQIS